MENEKKIENEPGTMKRYSPFSDREHELIETFEEKQKQFSGRPAFHQATAAVRNKIISAIYEIEWALNKFPQEQWIQIFRDQTILKLFIITENSLETSKWISADEATTIAYYETYSEKEGDELIKTAAQREELLKTHIIQLAKHFVHKELLKYIKTILDNPLVIAENDEILYKKEKKIEKLENFMIEKGFQVELTEIEHDLMSVSLEVSAKFKRDIGAWRKEEKEKSIDFKIRTSYERSLDILLCLLMDVMNGKKKPEELKIFVTKTREGLKVAISPDFQTLLNLIEKVAEAPTEKNLYTLKKAVIEYYVDL